MTDKKIDAYIDKFDDCIDYHVCVLKFNEYVRCDNIRFAHYYNILSKEEYQKKYPVKPKLEDLIEDIEKFIDEFVFYGGLKNAKKLIDIVTKLKQLNK